MIQLNVKAESWPIRGTFSISRGSKTQADVVLVELNDNQYRGRGECVPYPRYGESVEQVIALIEDLREDLKNGLDRQTLQSHMPAGAARNAVDCAFWDLQAKQQGKRAWQLAGIDELKPLTTAYTLSLDDPSAMRQNAAENKSMPLLKLKLAGSGDLARVQAVRKGSPSARIIIDANEGWTTQTYNELVSDLQQLGVEMIEQPFPAGNDAELSTLKRAIPICADESCHDANSLDDIIGKYDMVNIKLDKTGGLTEALKLASAAQKNGLGIMTGCMVSTSLAMAPAMVVAQQASIVDLDGPLLLAKDRPHSLIINDAIMQSPTSELWG